MSLLFSVRYCSSYTSLSSLAFLRVCVLVCVCVSECVYVRALADARGGVSFSFYLCANCFLHMRVLLRADGIREEGLDGRIRSV